MIVARSLIALLFQPSRDSVGLVPRKLHELNVARRARNCAAELGDLREIIGEFIFFDD